MPQARKSPSSNPDELAELLAAIGEDHFDIRQLGSVRIELQHIAAVYAVHVNGPRLPPTMARKLLRKFRANTAKRLELRRQLRSIRREILVAAWIQNSSDVDEDCLARYWLAAAYFPDKSTMLRSKLTKTGGFRTISTVPAITGNAQCASSWSSRSFRFWEDMA